MPTTLPEGLVAQLGQLRQLYSLLGSAKDSREHDDLIDRTRVAIAGVRRTRAMLAMAGGTNVGNSRSAVEGQH
jgi:hypothetical protein